ncbi:MAG: tetratricopeptide repeat protein [Eudoraea sp.]|nr:tetratricopeptide repeat protein [Eudoraea sp.]MBT8222153.1 tetratricopeptide repeat protein [Eudoraea sp.]
MRPLVSYFRLKFLAGLFLIPILGLGQSAQIDSLKQLIAQQQDDSLKVNTLLAVSQNYFSINPDSAVIYANQAISLANEIQFGKGAGMGYKNIGLAYYYMGDFDQVLENWEKSLAVFEEVDFKSGISNLQNNIGSVYQTRGDDPTALEYFINSLRSAEAIQDTTRIATALLNIGTVYSNVPSTYDQALEAYDKALPMFRDLEYDDGVAMASLNIGELYLLKDNPTAAVAYLEKSQELIDESNYGHAFSLSLLGKAYNKLGDLARAEQYYRKAISVANKSQSKMEQSKAQIGLAEVLGNRGNYRAAISNYLAGLDMANETGVFRDQADAYEGLAKMYAATGAYERALEANDRVIALKDTIRADNYEKTLGFLRIEFDLANKDKEISLLNAENQLKEVQIEKDARAKQSLYIILILFLAIIAGLVFQFFYIRRSNRKLAFERNRSERILLNILPKETAEELKENGFIKAKEFPQITVLFTDFKEFSVIARSISADKLVKSVDYYFKAFDEITERHNLEKIKTIGDAYMCAGGLPTENDTHADDAYNAAQEILQFVKEKQISPPEGIHPFEIRIGLNTGPVVAGVVGTKKFQYDIWGSTVNIAARMESNSIPGKINVSENTYQLLKDKKAFTYRGEVKVKNEQVLKMYFAEEGASMAV